MQRSVSGDRYLAETFAKNWRDNHSSQSFRLVDFQMDMINSEVGYNSFASLALQPFRNSDSANLES